MHAVEVLEERFEHEPGRGLEDFLRQVSGG